MVGAPTEAEAEKTGGENRVEQSYLNRKSDGLEVRRREGREQLWMDLRLQTVY